MMDHHADTLRYPFAAPPEPGTMTEVAPGIFWTRIALPFQLNHVNIFILDDGEGWAVIDTGIDNKATRAAWEALAAGPLAGRPITRLIVTHFHPDHIGLAGWLCERFDMPLLTTQTAYLGCLNISLSPGALDAKPYRDFYLRHGLDEGTTNLVATQGHNYLKMVTPLPSTFRRLVAGDVLRIGGREFQVLSGDGHAAEQIMLYCAAERIFLAADQVLARISPNVSVWAVDPDGDPLGL
ncbi:MAG: MBL fold metallo-hydrolase, partial [Hyphomicrobiales bacterium]|nr:MBL fold metallo-hydrolase [Hyphomicrobiales bacterium]